MIETYRLNAGVVVFNRQRKVLVCRRSDEDDAWQFPQGGIEKGETPSEAALRELHEETSICSVTLVKTLAQSAKYRFPPDVLAFTQSLGWKHVGQDMFWSLVYFYGDDTEINLDTEGHEFNAFRWVSLHEAYDLIVDFKKQAYAVAVQEFSPLIEQYAFPA